MCLPEDTICRLAEHLEKCGTVILMHNPSGTFSVGSEWGEEAPGSPMAGGAAYGINEDLNEALKQMLDHHGPKSLT